MQVKPNFKLDSGGFGEVWSGELQEDDGTTLRDDVVIKRLKKPYPDELRERFRLEMRLLRALDHPNIIEIIGSNASADPPFFVMPRAEASLRERLQDGLELTAALDMFGDICAGVAHAHANGVIHRDVKPENILILGGEVKVSDFGLGKNLAPDATLYPTAHGFATAPYAAPEQTTDPESVGTWTDVFALGKLLWELHVGEVPAPGCPTVAALGRVQDDSLQTVIERCCREEPSERYRDAGELIAALRGMQVVVSANLPAEVQLEQLVERWYAAAEDSRASVVRQIHRLLQACRDEESLYYSRLPYLPDGIIDQYAEFIPAGFNATVTSYLSHIEGSLPFSYCDVAARFLIAVFESCDQEELRRLALARVITIGATHNRYPVADLLRRLLWRLDGADAKLAADVLAAESVTPWYDHPRLYGQELDPAIEAAISGQPVDDDIVF